MSNTQVSSGCQVWVLGTRVQVAAYTRAALEGDHFGQVVKYNCRSGLLRVRLDKSGNTRAFIADDCRRIN